jgi:hypothetical protein
MTSVTTWLRPGANEISFTSKLSITERPYGMVREINGEWAE